MISGRVYKQILMNEKVKERRYNIFGGNQRMEPHIQAHQFSIRHRSAILKSEVCGCFYCLKLFKSSEIKKWIDVEDTVGQTAVCPECGIDSVIGSGSGIEITPKLLREMKQYWF